MNRIIFSIILILVICGCNKETVKITNNEIELPKPIFDSDVSIEKTLAERSSIRTFKDEALTLKQTSQLLWATQGIDAITGATRTAPSAGATHPLEVYAVVNNVEGLAKGIYHYDPEEHTITKISDEYEDYAPLTIILTAVYERTTKRYGERGIRYVHIEVGHAAQNIHLQAISLGLGSFPTGAFHDDSIKKLLNTENAPLYIIPVGKQ